MKIGYSLFVYQMWDDVYSVDKNNKFSKISEKDRIYVQTAKGWNCNCINFEF